MRLRELKINIFEISIWDDDYQLIQEESSIREESAIGLPSSDDTHSVAGTARIAAAFVQTVNASGPASIVPVSANPPHVRGETSVIDPESLSIFSEPAAASRRRKRHTLALSDAAISGSVAQSK